MNQSRVEEAQVRVKRGGISSENGAKLQAFRPQAMVPQLQHTPPEPPNQASINPDSAVVDSVERSA
jgi:hypothetical protein